MLSRYLTTTILAMLATPAVYATVNPEQESGGEQSKPVGDVKAEENQPTKSLMVATTIQPHFTDIPTGTAMPAPVDKKTRLIHPWGRPDLCLTVVGTEAVEGAEAIVAYCSHEDNDINKLQEWAGAAINNENQIKQLELASTNGKLCLAGGSGRSQAARPYLVACGNGENNEENREKGLMYAAYKNQLQIADQEQGRSFCLDMRDQSPSYKGSSWTSVKDVQLWECQDPKKENNQAWMIMLQSGMSSGNAGAPEDFEQDEEQSRRKRHNSRAWRPVAELWK